MPQRTGRLVALAVLAAAVAAIALPDTAFAGDVPRPSATSSAVSRSIAWKACGARLECARVQVPLDWDRPLGRTISLKVIRHLASRPEQRRGSLFINPGGPGDTGVGLVEGAGDDLDAWGGGRFDVVSWDPRGTNASTQVRCFRNDEDASRFWRGVSIPTSTAQEIAFRRKTADLARRCGDVSGWLLPHITTADTARDLDYLRQLVGDRRLTYVGLSYGTYLGQTYANLFPTRVRAMLLDGLVDPVAYSTSAETRVANSVSGADEVFDRFLTLCQDAGPEHCSLAGRAQDPASLVDGLVARAQRAPVPAPSATPPGSLDAGDLLLSQFEPLRNPDRWPQNATDLQAAIDGDGSALEMAARAFRTPAGWQGATTSAAIQCADAGARKDLRAWPRVIGRFDRISWLQGRVNGWWLWAPCAAWPVRGQDSYRGPWNASTANPILVIGTRFDPNTPYANAVRSARLLGNAVLLTLNGYGHLSFQDPSACIDHARVRYLVDLRAPPRGTVCQPDQPPFATSS
ncbi:MAG: alpha/beta fold hydrolase [Actinobacteria bacterium]|nr:alpha/beta fold hydrolase [Actinomycetota bacterium]